MKKIYISGKISGVEKSAIQHFKHAENELRTKGFEVVNPMELPHDHDKSWTSYLREDIKALADCDVIFMLANWTNSKGAKIEWELAQNLGLEIIYQK
jgi:nucleoside 2-deoxyribosyltransferase